MHRKSAPWLPATPAAVAALLLCAAPGAGASPGIEAAEAEAPPVAATDPMVTAVLADLAAQQERLDALLRELAATTDRGRAFELQRAITDLKREAEVRMLRIQAEHARRDGRAELAADLEAAIGALTAAARAADALPRDAAPAGR